MELGEKIRVARQNAGITQSELAIRIGISPQRISQYESNYRRPRPDLLARLAEELSVPISYFSDDQYLSNADAFIFKENVRKYFESINADPEDLKESGLVVYSRFDDERYRPTKRDVIAFAEETGITIDYLLGLSEDETYPAIMKELSKSICAPGFDEVDIGLIISHILRFFQNDLHVSKCTITDAEVIAAIILERIKAENIIPLAWLIDGVGDEIRNAALAVLNIGAKETDLPEVRICE